MTCPQIIRGLDDPLRSLDDYLSELIERLDVMRPDDPARGKLAARIREVEALIDARSGA